MNAHRRSVQVTNRRGLHARASAKFVNTVHDLPCQVEVEKDGNIVTGTSIMGLMMLAAGNGSVISVTAEGPDEEPAINALGELIGRKFEEA